MGRPMIFSIGSKIGTSNNIPQQLITTVIVKSVGKQEAATFYLFPLLLLPPPPPPPPPPPSSTKSEILQNGSRVNAVSFKVGGGELKVKISTTVYKGEYVHDGKLETEEKFIK